MRKVNRKMIRIIGLCILALLAVFAGYFLNRYAVAERQKENQEQIDKTFNALLLMQDTKDEDMKAIDGLLSLRHLSDDQMGQIYERRSYIYYVSGDMLEYYDSLANALFYLESSGNYEKACVLYTSLANYFYGLGNYQDSAIVMEKAFALSDISKYEDRETAFLAYRMYAKLLNKEGLPEEALTYLNLAGKKVSEIKVTNKNYELYSLSTLSEKINSYYLMGDYSRVYNYLNKYYNNAMIAKKVTNLNYASEFVLPYYELLIKLNISNGQYYAAVGNLDRYIQICDDFSLGKMKIDMINYVIESLPETFTYDRFKLEKERNEEYSYYMDKLIDEHCEVLTGQLENKVTTLVAAKFEKQSRKNTILRVLSLLLIAMAVAACVHVLILDGNTDELTGLRNRRAFDYRKRKLEKSGKSYGAIMFDIDHFKTYNDTYGHDFGDVVLRKIAKIIKSNELKGIKAYRYGGEEMIVLVETVFHDRLRYIAEHIRGAVEKCSFSNGSHVTVSAGIALKGECADPVKEADENMYFAKNNGRNATGYSTPEGRFIV